MAKTFAKKSQRLALLAGALIVSMSAGSAHADVFAGNALVEVTNLKGQVSSLESRINQMGQQQQELIVKLEQQQQHQAAAGPGPHKFKSQLPTSSRIAELDILAEPPYVVLGKVNDMTLVRMGEKRLLLDAERLAHFEELEYQKALKKNGNPDLANGSTPDLNLPPPPPPLANVSANSKADASALASASAPAGQRAARTAKPAATNKPGTTK